MKSLWVWRPEWMEWWFYASVKTPEGNHHSITYPVRERLIQPTMGFDVYEIEYQAHRVRCELDEIAA